MSGAARPGAARGRQLAARFGVAEAIPHGRSRPLAREPDAPVRVGDEKQPVKATLAVLTP